MKRRDLHEQKGLHDQNLERINNLESSLDWITRQNEAYDAEITALKHHNKCLHQAANQWQTQYNDAKILLLNTQNENTNLKIELGNLQLLHQRYIQQELSNSSTDTAASCISPQKYISLDQCLKENKQITKENLKYLNQIQEVHQKYTESTKKNDNLQNIKIKLQNELKSTKSRNTELDNIINEYTSEIKRLQNENTDLKQTLSHKNSDDSDKQTTQPPACSYRSPDFVKNCQYERSPYESPSVDLTLYERPNEDDINCIIQFDPCQDKLFFENFSKTIDPMDEKVKKSNELYQTTNDYLFQMDECVQILNKINKTQHAIIGGEETQNENDMYEEQKQLKIIEAMMKQLKYCTSEMHKRQMLDITDNRIKLKIHETQTTKKIRQLTKEMYNMKYNKEKKETSVWLWEHFNIWG